MNSNRNSQHHPIIPNEIEKKIWTFPNSLIFNSAKPPDYTKPKGNQKGKSEFREAQFAQFYRHLNPIDLGIAQQMLRISGAYNPRGADELGRGDIPSSAAPWTNTAPI